MQPMQHPTFDRELHESFVPSEDYVRRASMGLAIERVRREGIPGAFAELGVYQGIMSKMIHALAPERTLFLLDTFCGFPEDQTEPDWGRGAYEPVTDEQLREKIGDLDNIAIVRGKVPDTLLAIEDQTFAFVLMDMDTYAPTRAALPFVWARLSPGGYLFVHDYNNPESDWSCKRAVDEFFADSPWAFVEIPDMWGSVVARRHHG